MNFRQAIIGTALLSLMQACAVQNLRKEGENAYLAENYELVLTNFEQIIEKKESAGKQADAGVYFKAGMAAHKLNQDSKARENLETAENLGYSSPELYMSLAQIYKGIDNLSKEITALENYYKKYPAGKDFEYISARLFETYVESENWELASDLWPKIESYASNDRKLLTGYLIVNKNLDNKEMADEIAARILEMDPENIPALEWNAQKYFWQAENRYVEEMKAYEANRTHSQYNKLLKAWDKVFADYRLARDLYKKLYYIKPDTEYAKYLETIYKRMKEDDKAVFWRGKME